MSRAVTTDGAALGTHAFGEAGRVPALAERIIAFLAVAPRALKWLAEPAAAALLAHDPGALLPGWPVTDVLPVAALEKGNPVPVLVLLETDHGPSHRVSSPDRAASPRPAIRCKPARAGERRRRLPSRSCTPGSW